MTLTEFVADKIAVALNYRGLSKLNPVEFVIEGNAQKFIVLVSLLEPDTLTVPYNVTWINADVNSEDYGVLMRRVDAEKYDDKGYRGSWSVLSTVEEIYEEEQYYKKDSDPILGEVQQFLPPLAATTRIGGFRTTVDREDDTEEEIRVVVTTNDPRMSDAREPKPHTHPNEPRTMLSAGDGSNVYVNISTENDPVAGDVLFIKEQDEDGNFIGYWDKPSTEFAYVGPLPTSITAVGPADKVNGNSNHILRADVALDDGTKIYSVKATWSLVDHLNDASINKNTGVFHANPVGNDTPVTVRATWTHEESGVTIHVDFVIIIKGDPSLIILDSITIEGPATFAKSTIGTYTVIAHYTNGETETVTPNVFTSSNSVAGTFSGGVLTPKTTQVRDITTQLSATYVKDGVTRTGTLNVKITDPNVYPDSIAIVGANSLDQNTTSDYKAHVKFSDGTEADVTATWSVAATTYATVDQTGKLTAKELTTEGSKTVKLQVSFTQNTVTLTATKDVAIADTKIWPASAAITGSGTVAPGETQNYVYTVTYKDGSTKVVTPTAWASSNQAFATVDSTGKLVGVADGAITLSATYSEAGKNLNASKAVTIETGTVTIPPLRYGKAMFSNVNFTGGPIASEITQEEADYGVTAETSASGKQYTHWTGFEDFAAKVMTKTLDLKPGETKNFTETIATDEYVYIMWDARAGDTYLVDLANDFNVTFIGINYRNDVLGNEEGLPEYDPNLSPVRTVQFDDGTGLRPWKIIRQEATTLPAFSPRTNSYSIKYV